MRLYKLHLTEYTNTRMTDLTCTLIHVTAKQIQQSCLLSKSDPYMYCLVGPVGGVFGRGQVEVTQVVLLPFHLPRFDRADDPDQT